MSAEVWNQRYNASPFAYGKDPNVYFRNCLEKLTPGALLLPCEGQGRNAVYAAAKKWKTYAFDYSEKARDAALEWAAANNVKINYDVCEAKTYTLPRLIDALAFIYAHYPANERKDIHQRLWKCVIPGGHLIVEAFHPNQLNYSSGGPKDPQMLYTLEMLLEDFPRHTILDSFEGVISLDEGNFHKGEAHAVRLFLQKTL